MRRIILTLLTIWLVLALAPVAAQEGQTYYVSVKAAKVRAETTTSAKVITTLSRGTALVILEVTTGTKVSNSTKWYRINASGIEGYIHSSLVSDRVPAPTVINNSSSSTTNNSTANTVIPTSEPVSPIPAPIRAGGGGCGGATTCSQMASCDQAYACLQAGDGGLDRDKDGVPCESICPGG